MATTRSSIERNAKDVEIFRREPTTGVKDKALVSRKSVDSPRHWFPFACCFLPVFNGKRHAMRMLLKDLEI